MDFSPTEAQADLTALARRILTDQATPDRLRKLEDGADRFDPELWSALAEAGVPAATPEGPVVLLVEAADGGVRVHRQRMVDLDSAGQLELTDVALPADRVLGRAGQGAEVAGWLLARATVGLCALQLGVTERAL